MIMPFDDRLDRVRPKDGADHRRPTTFGVEQDCPRSIANFFDFRFCDGVLMVCSYTAEGKFLSGFYTIAAEIVVVEAEIVRMICLYCHTVLTCNSFVSELRRQGCCTGCSSYEVVEEIVGAMIRIKDRTPETLVSKFA